MQREILKPQLNIPLLVKLDFGPEGIERDGKYGKQYQYTVNDDAGVMWLDPAARQAILSSGAQAGDEIAITKRAKGAWQVERVSDAAEVPSGTANTAPVQQNAVHRTRRAAFPPASYYQPAPQLDSPLPITNGKGNGNGHNGRGNGTTQMSGEAPNSHPFEERYARMFVVAARALSLAHTRLTTEGMELEPFNWEDIRATAIHFAISFERKEERKA